MENRVKIVDVVYFDVVQTLRARERWLPLLHTLLLLPTLLHPFILNEPNGIKSEKRVPVWPTFCACCVGKKGSGEPVQSRGIVVITEKNVWAWCWHADGSIVVLYGWKGLLNVPSKTFYRAVAAATLVQWKKESESVFVHVMIPFHFAERERGSVLVPCAIVAWVVFSWHS